MLSVFQTLTQGRRFRSHLSVLNPFQSLTFSDELKANLNKAIGSETHEQMKRHCIPHDILQVVSLLKIGHAHDPIENECQQKKVVPWRHRLRKIDLEGVAH